MRSAPIVILAVAALVQELGAADAQPTDAIENAVLRVEVSRENGSIVRIHDKRTGSELVSDPSTSRLFRLMLPPIGERTRNVRSEQQVATITQVSPSALIIGFGPLQPDQEQYIFGSGEIHFPEAPLDIDVMVTLSLEGDHVSARLALDNRSRETVTGVIFPFIGGLNVAGETPARFVLPSTSQRVFPFTVGVFTGQRANRYPAMLASPWLNFENASGSLGIEVRSGLQAQDAYFALNPGTFGGGSAYEGRYEFPVAGWISYPQLAAGNHWTTPDARLHVHSGDWHQLAAEHRDWRRAREAPSRSAAWDEELGFATYRLKSDDNTIRWRYADLVELAEVAGQAGFSRLVIAGWRQTEGPGNPAPFGEIADPRLGGTEALRAVIAELAGRGIELAFAFHPALLNVFADEYPPKNLDWAVMSSRGAPQIPVNFLANTIDYPAYLTTNRFRIEIDPASGATDYLLDEAARLKNEYGMRNLFLVGVGQRAFLSYVRRTGLPPNDAYRVGYARLLGGLRELYSDGLLIAEGFNDLVNPWIDASYTWSQSHATAVLPFSNPGHPLSYDVEALDYRTANLAFAHGALINLIVDGGAGTVERYAGFARHLLALRDLKRAAVQYLGQAEFRDRDGLIGAAESTGAIARVFRNDAAGRTAVVVANLDDADATLDLGLADTLPSRTGTWLRADGTRSAPFELDAGVTLALGRHECAILAIDD